MTDGQVRLGSGLVKSTCIFLDEIFYKKKKKKKKNVFEIWKVMQQIT